MHLHHFSVLIAEGLRGQIRSARGHGVDRSPREALRRARADADRKLAVIFGTNIGGTPVYEEVHHEGKCISRG